MCYSFRQRKTILQRQIIAEAILEDNERRKPNHDFVIFTFIYMHAKKSDKKRIVVFFVSFSALAKVRRNFRVNSLSLILPSIFTYFGEWCA